MYELREQEQNIESSFYLKNRDEVLSFVREHRFLPSLLKEACYWLDRQFPSSERVLELISDPEVDDDQQLVLSVVSQLSPAESLKRLDRFDNEWWLDAMSRARNKLCITLEFR